jgi:hypothetical protein
LKRIKIVLSGCDLSIRKIGKTTLVTKSTTVPTYVSRLKKQADKQRRFNSFENLNIHVPKIYGELELPDYYSFDMEYCDGLSFVSFFEIADKENLLWFYKQLETLILSSINQSTVESIEISLILDKIAQVEESCDRQIVLLHGFENQFIALKHAFKVMGDAISLPIGPTHGDLTLSNIMIKNNESISLFDFLDSFIESPLLDIVKLRQDTRHHWSLNMLSSKSDITRLKILLEYLDSLVSKSFSSLDAYKNFYTPFQILNLLRILPYAKSEMVIKYLHTEINKLMGSELS